MAKTDPDKVAAKALAKLTAAVAGQTPGAGLVLQAVVGAALEGVIAAHPSDTQVAARAAEIIADRTARDFEAFKRILYELAGTATEGRGAIEELAEAVADPGGLIEHGRMREAMVRLFAKVDRQTDDISELAKAIQTPPRVSVAKLPITGPYLLGRAKMLRLLDEAWATDATNVVSLVAPGGVGKSALVNRWLTEMGRDGYRKARRVYGHSFYSQGTSDKTASADTFIAAALEWFGDSDPTKGSAWAKGERLAELVRAEPTLLILDGMEPLQHPPGPIAGRVTDPGLQALLRELGAQNPGLCVITTRQHVTDLDRFEGPAVRQESLEDLPNEAGAALLKALGVNGPRKELEQASEEFGNHALGLTLLGTYLAKAHNGDVRKRGQVSLMTADEVAQGGHAKRVMAWYEEWFGPGPEVSILRMLGLFNRPAEGGCIAALREGEAIPDLTDGLAKISKADWNIALANLREARLLAKGDPDDPDTLDAHPLVREHFGQQLEKEHANAWRAGHERLYEYLKGPGCPKELPDTIEEMGPLFAGMTHACAAGRHQEALDEVYYRRITRGDRYFSTRKLGAFGADLGALAGLFDDPWRRPVGSLEAHDQAFLLSDAGCDLRALGRLAEAVEPMLAAVAATVELEDWPNAARASGNVSELLLTLGRIEEAVGYAKRSVEFADRGDHAFFQVIMRTVSADALHQTGRVSEAEALFREAERMQEDQQPTYPLLYSLGGYEYCELLLARGDHQGVIDRATQTLAWATEHLGLLSIAVNHLSLGRAYLLKARAEGTEPYEQAGRHLDLAVDGLREAGTQDQLPRGLLARAEFYTFAGDYGDAWADLNEAMDIATRDPQGHMKLFVTDCHLGYARLALAQDDPPTAREHLAEARRLIEETGYHRRDKELEKLEERARNE